MKWKKYRLETTAEAEDIVSATLADLGVEGVEIEDRTPLTESDKQQMFVDIAPVMPDNDGKAWLSFYLDPDEDHTEMLSRIREELDGLRTFCTVGTCTIEESETEDKDWINNWKEYFHQFAIDDILVVPSWETPQDDRPYSLVLHMDPGMAFGTGMHETTQLCVRQIRKYLPAGGRVLDVGTGSGILGIIALKSGAGYVMGTDLDPCTVTAVAENKQANGIADDTFTLRIGNLIDDPETQEAAGTETFDMVTANILADVLVPLAPHAARCMKPGAVLVTSGILEGYEKQVMEACENAGLSVREITRQGEWVSVTAVKPRE